MTRPEQHTVPGLPAPSPRDAEIREVLLPLIEGCCWVEAHALLTARLREIETARRSHKEQLFCAYQELPETERSSGWLTWSHHRRNPGLE